MLRTALRSGEVEFAGDLEGVLGLIDHRRSQLQAQALQIGARVYAEKPGAFVARMRTMWHSGRGHVAAAAGPRPEELADAPRIVHAA